jgi:hypothetical protein
MFVLNQLYIITKEEILKNINPTLGEVQQIFSFMSNNYFFQVAAFRATLEEISESSLMVHVVDIR